MLEAALKFILMLSSLNSHFASENRAMTHLPEAGSLNLRLVHFPNPKAVCFLAPPVRPMFLESCRGLSPDREAGGCMSSTQQVQG